MYTTYFIIGFVTSFGWWSAGKVQTAVNNTVVEIKVETKTVLPSQPTLLPAGTK